VLGELVGVGCGFCGVIVEEFGLVRNWGPVVFLRVLVLGRLVGVVRAFSVFAVLRFLLSVCVFVLCRQTVRFITTYEISLPPVIYMAMQKTTLTGIVVAVAAIVVVTGVLAALQASRTFSNNGAVTTVNIGAFSDSGCTQALSTLSWGTVNPGSSASQTIYVKNTGSAAVSLNMTVTAWNPSNAGGYMSLTWNQEGVVLATGAVATTSLVLTVSSSVSGITNFSFNVTITGTQS
jgi:hypothetical protein